MENYEVIIENSITTKSIIMCMAIFILWNNNNFGKIYNLHTVNKYIEISNSTIQ